MKAMEKASQGHRQKMEVKRMLDGMDEYAEKVLSSIADGSYRNRIEYRELKLTGNNGKCRDILSPSLYTRVLQIAWMQAVMPYYQKHDPMTGLNCKEGCGITASVKNKSILHRLKYVMYDRRDLHYGLVMDQRKCYDHITKAVFRKKLKKICPDKWLVDFGVDVVFSPDGRFPVGTPSSPLAHHITMLDMDCMAHSLAPVYLRYADNVFLAAQTKEEIQQAKWRIKNWWWYDLGVRAKRQDTRIFPLSEGVDFCGYRVFRNEHKTVTDHDKGYTTIRRSIAKRMRKCKNNEAWASYYGLLVNADGYRLMTKIEKDMKLQELSARIRIDRKMDAQKIDVRDLADNSIVFTIHDYEIRRDREGRANWIKCLIGIEEAETGRMLAREFHGNYSCIIEAMEKWEETFGREQMLPIEDVTIENQCGYIFHGSTNQIKYIDEYEYKQSNYA